jgi:hypothetical protein
VTARQRFRFQSQPAGVLLRPVEDPRRRGCGLGPAFHVGHQRRDPGQRGLSGACLADHGDVRLGLQHLLDPADGLVVVEQEHLYACRGLRLVRHQQSTFRRRWKSSLPGTRPCRAGRSTLAAAARASAVQTITSLSSRGLLSRGSVVFAGPGAGRLSGSRTHRLTGGCLGSKCSLDASLNMMRQRRILTASENSGQLRQVGALTPVKSSHGLPPLRQCGRCT